MTKTEQEIIDRIKDQMKIKGFNQERLAQCLGTKQYNVSRMLDGKPFPSIDQLFLIAANFDCSIQYLLGLKDETYTELSPEMAKVARAYSMSEKPVKAVIERILEIDKIL